MKRLLQNIGWLLSGRAVNALLSLVYLALATRTLGIESFGYFALIVALGQTVTGLANFQTWQFVVRWGANGEGPGEATGFAIALDALSTVLGALLAGGLVYSAQFWLPLPHELLWVAFWFCIVSLVAMRSTPTGLLRLRFRFAEATFAEAVQPVVRAIGAVLAVIFMPSVVGFIIAWAAAEVAVALALWWAAVRKDKVDLSQISLTRLPRHHPDAWRFVLSTNAMGSLNVGGKQVMILLVGAIGGEAFAGGFRVASQLGQALVQLAQTVSKAIYPELVHAKDDAVEIARRMANLSLIGGAIAVLVAVLFGRWGLETIAGKEFGVVYWTMVILAVAGAIELVGASLESLLVAANRAGTAFLARAIPMVLAFSLLPVAMGWQGLKGAGFTVLGSSALAVLAFWAAFLSLQQIRIVLEPKAEPPPKG
ncbi:lipopolysaccharide biosynthesis protein [Parerythrobacter lacustris]|uniref:Lipopolysaccharide biosynthesis protein n=1 Tax=Parerythrobacter lacustris TaxID=2969984 RepID=A0ABT1XMD2_9SPHN|nr:lipopolysaccharide biosynthesis protein [Parerythrobacter lacustris]MCR2832825.1 lipopolysaccharide biosynthesis protein [Parerythrobacter lacustris]